MPKKPHAMTIPFNLGDLLDRDFEQGRTALIDLRPDAARSYTYGELDHWSGGVARYLESTGMEIGSRIAILSANRFEHVASYFGAMRAGFVAVPVNHKLSTEAIAYVLADSQCRLAFVDAERRALVPPGLECIGFDDPGAGGFAASIRPTAFETVVPRPDEIAQILYTSGSTGLPKGVPLSHQGQLWFLNKPFPPGAELERHIVAQPLFHMNGLLAMKYAVRTSAQLVLMPTFDARLYTEALSRHRITSVLAVPTMFARVLTEIAGRDDIDLSALKRVQLGSAPMTVAMLQRVQQAIPQAVVIAGYGTTEAGPSPFGPHPDGRPMPPLALGVEIAQSEVRLVDGPSPDEGVLVMRNPTVMPGYLNLPDKTRQVLKDGWYYSGDVMRRDADGFYYFVGRADDMFVCAGENIYPGEVEKVLERHPGVQQAVVLPLPDEERSHVPVAFVVLRPGASVSAAELRRHALDNGPAYQHPRRIAFIAEMPWAGTNKIDRAQLARRAAELERAGGWAG